MLEIRGIRKSFQGREVLHDVHLSIASGEFFSLLGPSGCGKTTLLRILAGLDQATAGEIFLDGQRVDHLPPQERPFNLVFQKHALFPHLTVGENVAFGLKMKKTPNRERQKKVSEALALVNLSSFTDRKPETLSGGQSQRVALARALVNEPRVLLLDEPLSALDLKMREHMQGELKALQKRLGITFISVTHDQDEALTLSDRIGLMNEGRLEQVSTPQEIYQMPKSSFAAGFMGRMSRLHGELISQEGLQAKVRLSDDTTIQGRLVNNEQGFQAGDQVEILIRPEKIRLVLASDHIPSNCNHVRGTLRDSIFKGDHTEIHLRSLCGGDLQTKGAGKSLFPIGAELSIVFDPEDTIFFPESRG